MKVITYRALLALALICADVSSMAATAPASATTVWRCGAEGRIYSDTPCAPGRELDVADPRSAEQVVQAKEVLAADKRRAEAMKRERQQRESQERSLMATRPTALTAPVKKTALREPAPQSSLQSPPRSSPQPPKSKRSRAADDGAWRAVAPASPRTPG